MRFQQRLHDGRDGLFVRTLFHRRKNTLHIARIYVDHRFVERCPDTHVFAPAVYHESGEPAEVLERVGPFPAAFAVFFCEEPLR